MDFCVTDDCKSTKARTGTLKTTHGVINTPVFMPVGTRGCVKTLSPRELEEIKVGIILGNTYHLKIRPGTEIIEAAGGLHAVYWMGKTDLNRQWRLSGIFAGEAP